MNRLIRERTWLLAVIGLGEALAAAMLGFPDAALGVVAGLPVGMANHWVTRLAMRRWQSGGRGAVWVAGGSLLRLALAAGLLWWASGRGLAFLIGVLAGLLVEAVGYLLAAPKWAGRRGSI